MVTQGAALHDAIDPLAAYVAAMSRGASVADVALRTVRHERVVIDRGRAQRIGLSVPACMLDRATLRRIGVGPGPAQEAQEVRG